MMTELARHRLSSAWVNSDQIWQLSALFARPSAKGEVGGWLLKTPLVTPQRHARLKRVLRPQDKGDREISPFCCFHLLLTGINTRTGGGGAFVYFVY